LTAPVLILGVSRSGTTLLKEMLDSHSALAIPTESYFVPQLLARHGRRLNVDAFLDDVGRLARIREWGVTPELVRERLPESPTAEQAIRTIYGAYADLRGKARYGDKTPIYMQRLDLLARVFPDAQYVHLLRDGRDAALSFVGMRRRASFNPSRPRGIAAFASQWRYEVEAARGLGRRLGAERYFELTYERLIAESEQELRHVCEFLGLEFEPAMLAYHERFDAAELSDHPRLAQPPQRDVRSWRREMSQADTEVFEAVAGDLLAELGYERAFPDPSPAARARAAAADTWFRARLASWQRVLGLFWRSPVWRVRRAYARRGKDVR
jgi:LPS sulfotransferase NodH